MQPIKLTLAGMAILAVVISLVAWGAGAPAPRPPSPISLQDIHDRGIEGRLGARLGTILEVSGEVVPHTSDAKADAGRPFFLKITTVAGKRLKTPVLYPFVKRNPQIKFAPSVGEKFHLAGFETGAFQGSPDGEFQYIPSYATTRYGFVTSFIVLAAK